jgi:hypothetical protein
MVREIDIAHLIARLVKDLTYSKSDEFDVEKQLLVFASREGAENPVRDCAIGLRNSIHGTSLWSHIDPRAGVGPFALYHTVLKPWNERPTPPVRHLSACPTFRL